MTYLLLGFALLAIGVLIANTAQMASQAALVRWLKRIAIALAVLIGVFLLATGRLGQALPLLFLALGLVMRFRRLAGRAGASTASPGQSSRVETAWLRMVLDHDTGTMAGTVLQGRFAGSDLAGLGVSDLIELYLDCLRADEPSARILETYLDRGPHAATWRHGMGDRDQEGERSQATSSAITIHEARDILGVSPLASSADIQAAHHRLMKFHHPDRGGSTYLAAKINAARDILLAAHQHSGEATR